MDGQVNAYLLACLQVTLCMRDRMEYGWMEGWMNRMEACTALDANDCCLLMCCCSMYSRYERH